MESKRKCDPELGRKVNDYLIGLGLETPMTGVRKIMIVKQQLNLSKET